MTLGIVAAARQLGTGRFAPRPGVRAEPLPGVVGVAGLAPTVSTSGAVQLLTDWDSHSEQTISKPAYLDYVEDPVFGTPLYRVTGNPGDAIGGGVAGNWATNMNTGYSKRQPWSADEAIFRIEETNLGGGAQLYLDGEDWSPIVARANPGPEARWHPTTAGIMIDVAANGSVRHWNPITNALSTLYSTTAYNTASIGDYEGNPSGDGRYIAVEAIRNSDSKLVVYVVDCDLGTKGSDLDVVAAGCSALDWATVSQGGAYLILHGTFSGGSQRFKVYDRATLTQVQYWTDYPLGHNDLGFTTAGGTEVVFGAPSGGTLVRHFITRTCSAGTVVDRTSGAVVDMDWHTSTRNTAFPGWGFLCVNDRPAYPFAGEIDALKLDGAATVRRICHHRHEGSGIVYACPSPSGKRVAFNSNWRSVGGSVSVYVADFRALWP